MENLQQLLRGRAIPYAHEALIDLRHVLALSAANNVRASGNEAFKMEAMLFSEKRGNSAKWVSPSFPQLRLIL